MFNLFGPKVDFVVGSVIKMFHFMYSFLIFNIRPWIDVNANRMRRMSPIHPSTDTHAHRGQYTI